MAKNVVASGIANKCLIQLAYAIGVPEPVSVLVNTYNTSKATDEEIAEWIQEVFDLSPSGIIKTLRLKRPIYQNTTNYGHFGREVADFVWERTDKVVPLRRLASKK